MVPEVPELNQEFYLIIVIKAEGKIGKSMRGTWLAEMYMCYLHKLHKLTYSTHFTWEYMLQP